MRGDYKDKLVINPIPPLHLLSSYIINNIRNLTRTTPHSLTLTRLTTNTMDKVKEVVGKVTGHPKLPTAKLGKNGPQVTRLGYGTMGLVSLLQLVPRSPPSSVTD